MSLHLKPQDVLVLLKLVAIGDRSWTYSGLAGELGMSASEVHGATKRLSIAQLFFRDSGTVFHGNAVEFLVSGARYAFPAEWGTQTVGLPTGYAAPPLNAQSVPGNSLPPVWPSRHGTVTGIALTPLYSSVPDAVHADPHLYELLALVDALRERFVFVGGVVLELLTTDPTVIEFRPTTDVDLVVEATTYGSYASVEQTLADRGFTYVGGPEAPICRWRIDEIIADVMPTEESIPGFGNRWYREVMRTARGYTLPSGMDIRLTAPQGFIATKLEAFRSRGNGDARLSYDMEDIIAVLDGRSGIEKEIVASSPEVRSHIAAEFRQLSTDTDFKDAIQGYLSTATDSAGRRRAVLERIAVITQEHP